MLDIKFIRENPEKVKQGAKNKGVELDINKVLETDKKRRELTTKTDQFKAEQNRISQEYGRIKDQADDDSGAGAKREELVKQSKELKEKIQSEERELKVVEEDLKALLSKIPNLPFDDVPIGKDETGNIVLKKVGDIPHFDFQPKEHWRLGEDLDIIDIKRAGKVAGSRFYYLKREAALMELALLNLAFVSLVEKGFIPVIPPVMIKRQMAWAMGYLEQTDDEEAYHLEKDDLYLTATSEQSLGCLHANEVFEEKDLPLRYVGFSTCFRREAGSYGKDTKGILRAHQFDKIEMFVFCKPEDSEKEHQALLANEEELMQKLELPYQVVSICTGDLGVPAAKKYDIEAWLAGQNRYRETHSTSNCTDFQTRRLNIKYRDNDGKLNFVHTLNGTAFSMRPIIALLENFQKKDGTVAVPSILQKYLGKSEIKKKWKEKAGMKSPTFSFFFL